jgi:hypothetical protein
MDYFQRLSRRSAVARAEEAGEVADSMDVRLELMRKVKAGEMTLAESQKELRRIKRNAKKQGKVTRNQAWNGHRADTDPQTN